MSVSSPSIRQSEDVTSRPMFSRKRRASGDMQPLSKRAKVTFDSEVEYLSAPEEQWDTDPAVVREEVRRAIQRHLAGDSQSYDRLCELFKIDPNRENAPSPKSIRVHLQATLANVSSLNKQCSKLVNAILNSEWAGRDQSHVALFFQFLGNLVAVNLGFLRNVLGMLVALFSTAKPKRVQEYKIVSPNVIHERAHGAIQHLLNLIPTAASALAASLQGQMRFDSEKAEEDILFAKNALKVAGYCEPLKSMILAHIATEVVNLDGHVQVELDEDEDLAVEDIINDLASSQTLITLSSQSLFEEGSPARSNESDSDDESDLDEDLDEDIIRQRKVKANIAKVDGILDLLFQYYDNCFAEPDTQASAVELLFSHFHTIIVPTYRSRHTQFIIFHFVQRSEALMDRFATSCVSVIFDAKQPSIIRQSTAAFLASFVSRGAHVSAKIAQDCFSLLCGLLTDLYKEYSPTCHGPNLRRYSAFYATAQALFYIFCFRWKDLMTFMPLNDDDDDDEDLDNHTQYVLPQYFREVLSTAIFSPLNPLKICCEAIVHEFATIMQHTQTMFLWSKVEINKRVRLAPGGKLWGGPVTSVVNAPERDLGAGEAVVMDDYFPFDPYSLPRSKRWVENDYRPWRGLDEGDEDDEEGAEGQDMDEEDDDDDDDDGDEDDSAAGEEEGVDEDEGEGE